MLLKFSVENYLSFKDTAVLSMIPASISQHKENLIEAQNYQVLKTVAIFGANASGKSNLFQAMGFAKMFVLMSAKEGQVGEKISTKPFLLSTETENKPSLFEFVFIKNNTKYRYGFRVNETRVVDEWLFEAKKIKETMLFSRHLQKFEFSAKFQEGMNVAKFTRNNALLLSVAAQLNGKISAAILSWFIDLNIISGLEEYSPITLNFLNKPGYKDDFINILKTADFSIEDFRVQERNLKDIPDFIQKEIAKQIKQAGGKELKLMPEIKTLHNKYDKNLKQIGFCEFDLMESESQGTRKLFSFLGPILNTIKDKKVLVIDEFESNLHPLISRFLIKLFNIKNKNAQIIFNTHDTTILSNEFFRRDQLYFVNKDKYGQSELFSLYEKYDVRYDRIFNKDYLEGRYKAVPFIDEFGFFQDNISFVECEH